MNDVNILHFLSSTVYTRPVAVLCSAGPKHPCQAHVTTRVESVQTWQSLSGTSDTAGQAGERKTDLYRCKNNNTDQL